MLVAFLRGISAIDFFLEIEAFLAKISKSTDSLCIPPYRAIPKDCFYVVFWVMRVFSPLRSNWNDEACEIASDRNGTRYCIASANSRDSATLQILLDTTGVEDLKLYSHHPSMFV